MAGSFSGSGGDAQEAAAPVEAYGSGAAAPPVQASYEGVCGNQMSQFRQCLDRSFGEMSSCQHLYDALQQCKQDAPYMTSESRM